MNEQSIDRFLRDPQVFEITKLSKSTRWRLEKAGMFPKRRRLSTNAVGWIESEVQDWLLSRLFVDQQD